MRVLVVGNASLTDLILKAGKAPGASSVAVLTESPGIHGTWVPGGAATTIALAIRETGHEVELCHPLPARADHGVQLNELARRGIGLARSPRTDLEAGRCILVYGEPDRFAWSTPPDMAVTATPAEILKGIDYVVVAPVWSPLSEQIVAEANRLSIPCAMVGEFRPGAAKMGEWDLAVLDVAQHESAKDLRAKSVVITDGANGSRVIDGSVTVDVKAVPARVVDTTGAGDTYGGAYIGARLSGRTHKDAADYASKMAAWCCEGAGSWAAYVRRDAQPSTSAITIRDRVLGAVWGTACGDAFGMPNSFLQTLPWLTQMMPGPANSPYHAGYPAGRITDDTEQAMALTEALLVGFTPEEVATRLNEWFIGVGGEASLAVGPSTKRAMLAFAAGGNVYEIGRLGVTNGSAMRVAPVGVVAGLKSLPIAGLIDLVETSCIPTHFTSPAISGAGAIAAAVAAAIRGAGWDEIIDASLQGADEGAKRGNWIYAPSIRQRILLALKIADSSTTPIEFTTTLSETVGTGEPCTESVPAAIACAHYAKGDPALAIELCANSRGDTDTTAAMAGAICGAYRGWEAIPEAWRSLVGKVNMLDGEAWATKLEKAARQ